MNELSTAEILRILQDGNMEIEGLLPWSSNYTFLVHVCENNRLVPPLELVAVYKPRRGERPLWDFSAGTLCHRERAAFLISHALTWDIVPPTVLRDGDHGLGSVQFFIDHNPERHYFTIEGNQTYRSQLQRMVLFDILINNADRKSGHVLLQQATDNQTPARLWGIDHGICFHSDPKMRTVIWEFVGQPIPAEMLSDLIQLNRKLETGQDTLLSQLTSLLLPEEITALRKRLHRLMKQGAFPGPGAGRQYPWPPI